MYRVIFLGHIGPSLRLNFSYISDSMPDVCAMHRVQIIGIYNMVTKAWVTI